jgi:hypothetical protein
MVVPSKFFGSLAAGRPVIFAGPSGSAIARWIEHHQVGWVLNESSEDGIAAQLRQLAECRGRLEALQQHCHDVYHRHFSRQRVMSAWDQELRSSLALAPRGEGTAQANGRVLSPGTASCEASKQARPRLDVGQWGLPRVGMHRHGRSSRLAKRRAVHGEAGQS